MCINSLFLFFCRVVFHCEDLTRFIYPCIRWRTSGVFPVWGNSEYSCSKLLWQVFSVNVSFHFSRGNIHEWDYRGFTANVHLALGEVTKCSPKVALPFCGYIVRAIHESSGHSTPWLALGILSVIPVCHSGRWGSKWILFPTRRLESSCQKI